MMRRFLTFPVLTAIALFGLLGAGQPPVSHAGSASCLVGTDPEVAGDAFQIRAVRTLIDTVCRCRAYDGVSDGAKKGDYKRCVKGLVLEAVDAEALRRQCKGTVKRAYKGATCGQKSKPGKGPKQPCVERKLANDKVKCRLRFAADCVDVAGKIERSLCIGHDTCVDAADTNGDLLVTPADGGTCAAV